MNNAQIIFSASQELAEDGKIKYTGRVIKAITPEGAEVEFKETEALHTYKEWQRLGFQVKKGQKAVAKITIWNWTSKKEKLTKEEADHINATVINADGSKAHEGDEVETKGHYYMKEAAFFSASQVEAATATA